MLMEDSTTYQEILEKGRTQGDRSQANLLLRVGTKKFDHHRPRSLVR